MSRSSRLTPLQHAVLKAFFEQEGGFWLTGGAALAGFHLGHRRTDDLDLFTADGAAFERGEPVVRAVAEQLGLSVESLQSAPGFRRLALSDATGAVVVDLVLDRVPQLHPDKPLADGVRVDPSDEIFANKLTALVGRMEERDLVDVLFLERAGHRVEDFLAIAQTKDAACTPATLAWLLSEVTVPDGASLPAGVEPAVLREWLTALVGRLARAAHPGS